MHQLNELPIGELIPHNANLISTFGELTEQAAMFQIKVLGDALERLY